MELKDLMVGDNVLYYRASNHDVEPTIQKITKKTPSGMMDVNGVRFNKDGYGPEASFSRFYRDRITVVDQDVLKHYAAKRLLKDKQNEAYTALQNLPENRWLTLEECATLISACDSIKRARDERLKV